MVDNTRFRGFEQPLQPREFMRTEMLKRTKAENAKPKRQRRMTK